MSRMKCACQRRSKPSLHIPANAAMPRIASSAGRARTRRAPCARRVRASGRTTHAPRAAGARTSSPASPARRRAASTIAPAPATTIGRRRSTTARPTLAPIPASDGDAPDLGAAQVDAGEALAADLVREPGIEGAARERVAEAPERVRGEDRPHLGEGAEEDHGDAHHGGPDHDREAPRVDVRDDAGRHLEDEDRDLHERADEHELEGAHADLRDVVDGGDGEGEQRRGTRQPPRRRTRSRARTGDCITMLQSVERSGRETRRRRALREPKTRMGYRGRACGVRPRLALRAQGYRTRCDRRDDGCRLRSVTRVRYSVASGGADEGSSVWQ